MGGPSSMEHRERALRLQEVSDRARERDDPVLHPQVAAVVAAVGLPVRRLRGLVE